jgi:hypothetical protein
MVCCFEVYDVCCWEWSSGGFLEQHQSMSPMERYEADHMEEVVHTEILSSSTSASDSKEVMDWSRDGDVDLLKDEMKSPRKSPAKPNGMSIK